MIMSRSERKYPVDTCADHNCHHQQRVTSMMLGQLERSDGTRTCTYTKHELRQHCTTKAHWPIRTTVRKNVTDKEKISSNYSHKKCMYSGECPASLLKEGLRSVKYFRN